MSAQGGSGRRASEHRTLGHEPLIDPSPQHCRSARGRLVRRPIARALLVGAAVIGSMALSLPAASPAGAAPVSEALVIGDSVLAGVSISPSALSALETRHSVIYDAKVCRRLIAPSCPYLGVTPSTGLAALRAHRGDFTSTLVVGAGYNDTSVSGGLDAILTEARAQRITSIIWLTYRVAGASAARYAAFNDTLRARAVTDHDLHVIDWDTLGAPHPEWFSTDGLHLRPDGAMAMAGFIADGLDAYPGYDRCAAPHWIGSVPPSTVPDTSSAPGGGIHPLAAPFRMLDTRPLSGKLGAGRSLTVPIVARGGVSPTATSVLATITTTEGCADSFVTAYPCGAGVPTTSVVNALTNTTVANGVLVKLSGSGALCIYANAPVDVIVDVAAWIGPSGAAPTPVTPDRLVDSRPGFAQTLDLPQQRLAAGTTLDVPIGALPAAAGAAAVAVNLTAVDPGGDGYLTVFPGPCSATPPLASNVNVTAGHTTAAGATSAVGGGSICVYTSVATDVVVDLDAVYGPGATSVVTTAPKRLFDTRDTTRVDAGATIEIDLDDPALGAPPTATGIVANLTATGPSSDGYLTMYPCGTALPNVSNLNVTGGHTVANLAISGAGIGRRICIFSLVTTDVLLDREGWITG